MTRNKKLIVPRGAEASKMSWGDVAGGAGVYR